MFCKKKECGNFQLHLDKGENCDICGTRLSLNWSNFTDTTYHTLGNRGNASFRVDKDKKLHIFTVNQIRYGNAGEDNQGFIQIPNYEIHLLDVLRKLEEFGPMVINSQPGDQEGGIPARANTFEFLLRGGNWSINEDRTRITAHRSNNNRIGYLSDYIIPIFQRDYVLVDILPDDNVIINY